MSGGVIIVALWVLAGLVFLDWLVTAIEGTAQALREEDYHPVALRHAIYQATLILALGLIGLLVK